MRQIIYDKVRNISEKYKGYIDTEDLMKEGLTNRQIGLLTAEEKLEKIAHGHYWVNSDAYGKPEDYKAVEVARVNENAVFSIRNMAVIRYMILTEVCVIV